MPGSQASPPRLSRLAEGCSRCPASRGMTGRTGRRSARGPATDAASQQRPFRNIVYLSQLLATNHRPRLGETRVPVERASVPVHRLANGHGGPLYGQS